VLIVVASAHRGAAFRCLPMVDRYFEEDGADLEERTVCGWGSLGGWEAFPKDVGLPGALKGAAQWADGEAFS